MTQPVTRITFVAMAAAAVALSSPDATASHVPGALHAQPAKVGGDTKVAYWGGHVLSTVQVVAVFWTSAVDSTVQSQIGGFYTTIVKSSFIDWLTEYDTIGKNGQDGQPGSSQHIGRGEYVGAFTIQPSVTGKTLQDSQVSAELVAQIASGALPKPALDAAGNVDTLYMIEFPPGYSISEGGGQSCSQFGGYHSSVPLGGVNVPYAVLPDCAAEGETFPAKTQLHSHELVESITDTEIGAATGTTESRPLAWMASDSNGDEIGDLCESGGANAGTQISAVVDGYTVQLIWSNYASACVAGIPICDGSATPPQCRPCTQYDNDNACSGATPQCDTTTGFCVAAPPPPVDAGASSGGSGGSSGGSSSGSSSGSSGGSSGAPAGMDAGMAGTSDAGLSAGDDPFGGGGSAGCRVGAGTGRGGDFDVVLVAGLLVAAMQRRRRGSTTAMGAHGGVQARTRSPVAPGSASGVGVQCHPDTQSASV